MDEIALRACPSYTPMTKEEVEDYFRYMGATDEDLQERIEAFDRMTEAQMSQPNSFLVVGVSPFL